METTPAAAALSIGLQQLFIGLHTHSTASSPPQGNLNIAYIDPKGNLKGDIHRTKF